ncbi:MAG: lysophospholipid acyltransferase family protein [Caldilineaceae bacterium]
MNQSSTLLTYSSEVNNLAKKALVQLIEQATGRSKLERIYAYALEAIKRGDSIWSAALHGLQVTLDYDVNKVKSIPTSGPLIFVANHPYGVLDGLAICYLASQARHNFRIFISKALCREERIAPYVLPIDFDGGEQAIQTNLTSMRKAVETLQEEGAIIIFPGGGISTALTPFGPVGDLEWKLSAAKLIHQTKATVIPIFFHGQNSHLFHLVSFFSLSLRLSLIMHELNKMMSQTLRISIGDPIPYEQLAAHKSRKALTDHLRKMIYTLGDTPDPGPASLEWKENWERNLDRMKY